MVLNSKNPKRRKSVRGEKMANKEEKAVVIPSMDEIQHERKRIRRKTYYRQALRGTVAVLVVVAAVAVLITTLFLPILQISGDSMSPSLQHDEIVVLLKTKNFKRGDLIGFYYQGKILLKRVIALPEDEVAIDSEGNVYVNGEILEEPYVTEKCLGDCNLEFPYKVPGTEYFVMGDKRSNSVDSRNTAIGTISNDDIIGKVFIRVWPFSKVGFVY
jgi:signal peptidase I